MGGRKKRIKEFKLWVVVCFRMRWFFRLMFFLPVFSPRDHTPAITPFRSFPFLITFMYPYEHMVRSVVTRPLSGSHSALPHLVTISYHMTTTRPQFAECEHYASTVHATVHGDAPSLATTTAPIVPILSTLVYSCFSYYYSSIIILFLFFFPCPHSCFLVLFTFHFFLFRCSFHFPFRFIVHFIMVIHSSFSCLLLSRYRFPCSGFSLSFPCSFPAWHDGSIFPIFFSFLWFGGILGFRVACAI